VDKHEHDEDRYRELMEYLEREKCKISICEIYFLLDMMFKFMEEVLKKKNQIINVSVEEMIDKMLEISYKIDELMQEWFRCNDMT
jgi:hypothetical protein